MAVEFPYGFGAFLLPLVVGVLLIALAVWVVRVGRIHRHNLLFGALQFTSGTKSLSEAFLQVGDQFHAEAPLFPGSGVWQAAANACALLLLPLLVLFLASFPRPARWLDRWPWSAALLFLPSATVGLLLFGGAGGEAGRTAALAFNLLLLAASAAAVWWLLRVRGRARDAAERRQSGILLMGLLPSFAFGWALTLLSFLEQTPQLVEWELRLLLFLSPPVELLAAAVVAYAILRYRLLGVDQAARLSIRSAVLACVLAALFVASQFFQNEVLQAQVQGPLFGWAGRYGSYLITGVVGLVLLKPVDKLGQKASARLLPKSAPESRAAEVYRAQCAYVLRDAQVSDREWAFLRNLRGQLGLAEGEARRIEQEVERSLKVDDPRTGQGAAPPAGT